MRETYEVREDLRLGKKVYVAKDVVGALSTNRSGALATREITGHLNYTDESGNSQVMFILDGIEQINIRPYSDGELMTEDQARNFIADEQKNFTDRVFGGGTR
jgi:hypothetical protein